MNKHMGESFEAFLDERGIRREVELLAKKKILAQQIRETMASGGITRSELAGRMQTSRTVVHRLLDENDTGVTLATLANAADALGLELALGLAAPRRPKAKAIVRVAGVGRAVLGRPRVKARAR